MNQNIYLDKQFKTIEYTFSKNFNHYGNQNMMFENSSSGDLNSLNSFNGLNNINSLNMNGFNSLLDLNDNL
jgi:hypothetical protein